MTTPKSRSDYRAAVWIVEDSQLYRENLSQVSFFLVSKAIIDVPINVALQYKYKLFRTSELKQELAIVQGSSMLPI